MRSPRLVAQLARILSLGTLSILLGCGEGGNHVTGNVLFQGKPVPVGKIFFYPDSSKGNSGAPGWAEIKDGRYNTAAEGGSPVASGAMRVVIEGIDPNPPANAESPDVTTTVLFSGYETTVDLSQGNTTKDFDVPAEAAKGPAAPKVAPTIVP
jgi:hypothetical protein